MRDLKIAGLMVCKYLGLFRLAHWFARNHLRVLCYHGFELNDEASFRPKLFISRATFAKRLAIVKNYGFAVLPLDQAIDALYARALPARSLAITIDDGFYSVLDVAAPLLKAANFPATVYVTSYYVQNANPIFRLAVQYMFWKTPLQSVTFQDFPWSTDTTIHASDLAHWSSVMWTCIHWGEQHCTEAQRVALCADLGKHLEVPYETISDTRLLHLMTPAELAKLSEFKLDIQLHTHRHHFPDHDQAGAEREIADNRRALAELVPTLPRETLQHFCYPSGLWKECQWDWLDAMGIKSTTTCLPGLNSAQTPRHAIKRFLDGENIHPIEFEAALSGFTDLLKRRY